MPTAAEHQRDVRAVHDVPAGVTRAGTRDSGVPGAHTT